MKNYFIAMMAAMLLSMPTMAQKGKAKSLEVSFNYQKQAGPGSNQLKDRVSNVCKYKDALTPVLEEIAQADGLVMGSPIYFSEVTAQLRMLLERLIFPWLSYEDFSLTAPKRMPVLLTYTMNANTEQAKVIYQMMGIIENCLERAFGEVEHVDAYNTYQVKNYDRYALAAFPEPMKRQYREEHWEQDLQRAFDAGKRMAEKICLR